jgi:protein-tyrosine-phosphatase
MAPWTLLRQPKTFILFLDTGDICRCPMAKGVFAHILAEAGITHVEILTAGVMTTASILPTQETRLLLTEAGIDIGGYRSTQYTEQMIRKADLVLGMSPFHVQKAKRLIPEARDKTHLLKEFTGVDRKNVQIPDPMGATLEVYRKVFRDIQESCKKLVEMEIVRKLKPTEGEDFVSSRTTPGRSLTTAGQRKVAAPPATRALMSVLAQEDRQRKAAESIGFPVAETDVEVTMRDEVPEEIAAAPKKKVNGAKKSSEPAAAVKKLRRVSGAARPVAKAEGAEPEQTASKATDTKNAAKPSGGAAKKKAEATKAAGDDAKAKKAPAASKVEEKTPEAAKPEAAKPAPKKEAAKKATPKKDAPKKPAPAKKAAVKKPAAKKPVEKQTAEKKTSDKKPAQKKAAAKKPTEKKPTEKKAAAKKPAARPEGKKAAAAKKAPAAKKPAKKK